MKILNFAIILNAFCVISYGKPVTSDSDGIVKLELNNLIPDSVPVPENVESLPPSCDKINNDNPPISMTSLLPYNTNMGGETVIHRPSDIIIRRPPTNILVRHPPITINPAPIVFHKPPARIKHPNRLKYRKRRICLELIEPVFNEDEDEPFT